MKTNLDALAIGNFYLRKQDQPEFNHETEPKKQKNHLAKPRFERMADNHISNEVGSYQKQLYY